MNENNVKVENEENVDVIEIISDNTEINDLVFGRCPPITRLD